MPIEIRELVIKVTVHDDNRRPGRGAGSTFSAEDRERLRKEITESCVRQVLNTLDKRNER